MNSPKLTTAKDGPTVERRAKGDLDYLVEAGPENKGTVGHFKAVCETVLDRLYVNATISHEQYQAGKQYESFYITSGLGGRPQRGRMERTDGFIPEVGDARLARIIEAKEKVFEVRWMIADEKLQKLFEAVVGESVAIREAARRYDFHEATARRKLKEKLDKVAMVWGFYGRRISSNQWLRENA